MCPEGTEDKYVTSPSGESLGRNVHVRCSKLIRNFPHRYYPGFCSAREWKNEDVASIVYMIQYRGLNSNVDTDDIRLLLAGWDAEVFMDVPSTFQMKESFFSGLKSMILIL